MSTKSPNHWISCTDAAHFCGYETNESIRQACQSNLLRCEQDTNTHWYVDFFSLPLPYALTSFRKAVAAARNGRRATSNFYRVPTYTDWTNTVSELTALVGVDSDKVDKLISILSAILSNTDKTLFMVRTSLPTLEERANRTNNKTNLILDYLDLVEPESRKKVREAKGEVGV